MEKIFISPRAFAAYGMDHIKTLIDMGYDVVYRDDGVSFTPEEFEENASQALGIIVGTEPMGEELLKKCVNLKYLVRYGVGTDNIDLDTVKKLGIVFDRCAGSNSTSVAERAIALMMAMAKSLPKGVRNVRDGRWDKVNGIQLLNKKLGVIGFGDIGKEVSRIAAGMGMRVSACATKPIDSSVLNKYSAINESFDEIIATADVISVSVPLTDKTRNMISMPEMERMKDGVIIVNTARGGIINDKDALEMLKAGKIRGYATDVFLPEPPVYEPWVQELLSLDSFILTPHMASRTKEADQNMVNMSAEKLINMLKANEN